MEVVRRPQVEPGGLPDAVNAKCDKGWSQGLFLFKIVLGHSMHNRLIINVPGTFLELK